MPSSLNRVIGYIRVSTVQQGMSGLGLEAQTEAVAAYARANNATVLATYREIESGRNDDRPELRKALAHAKRLKIRCVFAKLDRLSRKARLLLEIVESGADVVFCDLPNIPPGPVGKFILTNMAAAAELEAGLASVRTKDGLRAAKARGVKLGSARDGSHKLAGGANPEASRRAGVVATELAAAAYEEIGPLARQLRAQGLTLQQVAEQLSGAGHTTRTGKAWNKVQVSRVLDRDSL